jgi:tetratricopeptide (TPR) repeat protein
MPLPLVCGAVSATLQVMKVLSHHTTRIVAAFVLAVGFSIPAPDLARADDTTAATLDGSTADLPTGTRVDDLLAQLKAADAQSAPRIEAEITAEWSKSGSPAMDLLLQRGEDAIEAGNPARAVEHFTAAIDYAPDFAEAYNGRATAYYLTDDIGPALADLQTALTLNPQHFGALKGFAIILEELGRPEDALDIYRQVLAIHPQDADVAGAVDRLVKQLEGQTL